MTHNPLTPYRDALIALLGVLVLANLAAVMYNHVEVGKLSGLYTAGTLAKATPTPTAAPSATPVPSATPAPAVELIVLTDATCQTCPDYDTAVQTMQTVGINLTNITNVDYNTTQGQALLAKYNITSVPTVILSAAAWQYPTIQNDWLQVGTQEADGTLVLRKINPPYRDLTTGNLTGQAKIISLVNSSCQYCYDVRLHHTSLGQMGLVFTQESEYEINSTIGQQLIKNYSIEVIPTILISPDASVYPIMEYWTQLGTVEPDGWYVFRNRDALPGRGFQNVSNSAQLGGPILDGNTTVTVGS